ncbi:hypothetical protein CEW88_07550 [Alloyangia pacifica]|uniref:Uncharacterized protein n=1 Tax=Alloyangia pacifica TaxID=311180 RepID=A0A2U8HEY6_9RHOB|nr:MULTISPECIES: hypothetical protein [Roseobacteraceae]AWI83546.1 hypothetical protein CEW88_07550 [Alloyangia pacifica]NDV52511.1 hypothetical protein [Salipiger sp. PrR003]NDW32842.1 hypothetical protein [Salipiger sp. PrR007]
MNWQSITRNWGLTAERLPQRFPHLDSDELRARPRSREELTAEIARRHDLTLQEAERELDDWAFALGAAQKLDRLAG